MEEVSLSFLKATLYIKGGKIILKLTTELSRVSPPQSVLTQQLTTNMLQHFWPFRSYVRSDFSLPILVMKKSNYNNLEKMHIKIMKHFFQDINWFPSSWERLCRSNTTWKTLEKISYVLPDAFVITCRTLWYSTTQRTQIALNMRSNCLQKISLIF